MPFREYTFKQFIQLAFSENGSPSSKRIMGAILIIFVIIATIICVFLGYTLFLENILQAMLITGASLLGLSSITSIWKHNDGSETHTSVGDSNKNEECI